MSWIWRDPDPDEQPLVPVIEDSPLQWAILFLAFLVFFAVLLLHH